MPILPDFMMFIFSHSAHLVKIENKNFDAYGRSSFGKTSEALQIHCLS